MSSKFYGVGWHKQKRKWRAFVRHNGKYVNLGCNFDTELAAAKAVDVWLRENGRAAEANFDDDGNFVPRVSTKSSKYRGVGWNKGHDQWQAQIKVAGENEILGYFDDEAEAARAYDTRARQLGYPPNFDENGVEIDYGSDAVLQAQAAQAAAKDGDSTERCGGCSIGCSGQPHEGPQSAHQVGAVGRCRDADSTGSCGY